MPPLKNELATHWPMITWHGPGHAPLESEQIQFLLDRGLTQNLRLDEGHIEAARRLQEAGSPVPDL